MGAGFRAIKLASDAETLSTTFRVLVGNAELARKTLKDLEDFALTTPFEMPELIGASKQMIAFGEEADNIVPAMRMLGNVSAGLGIRIGDLTYLYGTLRSQGRAFTVDIRQFAMRGIPIYLELAKVMGLVSKETKKLPSDIKQNLNKMIEEGAVNFDLVEKAFQNMTGAGGQFFNLMEERSKTIEGLFNEMRESIDLSLREIGNTLIEGLQLNVVIRQITEATGEVNKFLKTMSVETKRAILIGMGLIAVFVGITAVIYTAGIALTIFSGGLNIWAGLITAAIGLTGLWVYEIGGLQKAWKIVKRAAMDFWQFIKPILPLLGVLIAGITVYFAPWIAALALIVYYWDDVVAAVKDAYKFIEPTLDALWRLTKTVAFAVRDNLVKVWDQVVVGVTKASEKVRELWGRLTGGQRIDWGRVKEGLRDLVMFVEYSFNNISLAGTLAWDIIKYAGFYALDEIVKHMFIVPIAIIGLFLGMSKTVKSVFENMLIALVQGVDASVKMIWEAIKSGKVEGVADAIKKQFENVIVDSVKTIDNFKNEVQKRVGKVSFNEIEVDGIKVPVGLNIEGLQKERRDAYNAVVGGMKEMEKGFQTFKAERALKIQFENAAELFLNLWQNIVTPFMFPKSEIVQAAAEAGKEGGEKFKGEFKKVEAVLAGSAEAFSRMAEYRERQPNVVRNVITKADVQQMVIAQSGVQRNVSEEKMVELLQKIADLSEQALNKEPIQIVPADLP